MLEMQVAFVLGALHALEPGHGKTAMTTYMLNSDAKWYDSLLISLSAGLTHTALIIALAGMVHLGSHMATGVSESLSEHLSHVAGIFLVLIGGYLIFSKKPEKADCCSHSHHHPKKPGNLKMSAFFGLTLGLFPCPSLLAAFALSLNSGDTGVGLISVVLFAVGMIISMFLCGLVLKWIGKKSEGLTKLPINWRRLQGVLIAAIGVYYAVA